MTQPTQAQIEAAAIALCQSWPKAPDGCAAICMGRLGDIPKEGCQYAVAVHGKRAEAALTAAAEVGKMDIEDCDGNLAEIEQIAESRANIAAAEVGEQERDLWKVKHIKAIEAATIERCAQMARECKPNEPDTIGMMEYRFKIAAAIRALRDK